MRSLRVFTSVLTVLAFTVLTALSGTAAPGGPPDVLRAVSFNMHAGIGADGELDLERVAEVIRHSRADVVGLQEVDVHFSARSDYVDQATRLAELTGMRVFFAPIYDLDPEPGHSQRRRFGVAILSRHPIVATTNHELTRKSTVGPPRSPTPMPGFAEAVVSVRGRHVHVYSTHLDYRADPAVRRTQVAETVRVLDGDPPQARQVLLGDLNAEPAAPELGPLFQRVRDAWGTRRGGLTYPAPRPVKRIDYITFAGPMRVEGARVPRSSASDHLPVLALLRLDLG
ncbi:endonuclease/exonuclease/phosphatase family metal-dependent hydrolase [Saccharomonospora amisosensis]|uniref:Endonuclease/exonuclease/phosphatase family metal-dependent hydrolase n=1 Tax=Saccharomonospora amisosensis TaxID=1128677 RepID=A0A7X5UR63_9PSEU|nr:endonuclease/exonuclease/phosphatase family protein [Saccharomonospora amisosensis]NIJ12661.1 endonuclease/exonuclease/phosphatase family metal-dependent hydrolase [Saccharomonospora amisosensis]